MEIDYLRLQRFIVALEASIGNNFFLVDCQIHSAKPQGSFSVELVVSDHRLKSLEFQLSLMRKVDLNEGKPDLEGHQDIVAEVDILDLLQSRNVLIVDLAVVLFPLEGGADLLDVVLELDEERLHGFVVVRLDDVHLLVHFLLEDDEETIVAHQFVYPRPDQTDLLLRKTHHGFFRKEHQL